MEPQGGQNSESQPNFHGGAERMTGSKPALVLMAKIGAAHGVHGEMRVKPYVGDPQALGNYGPLCDRGGNRWFTIRSMRTGKSMLVVRFDQVCTRTHAESLTGTKLFIPRENLPKELEEDEYYHVDLVGLDAVAVDGSRVGQVIAVQDFGAGDLLEVKPQTGDSVLIPFTREFVPNVDLAAGTVTVDVPEG